MEHDHQSAPQEFELTSRLNAWKSQGAGSSLQPDPFATPQASAPNTVPGSRFASSTALNRLAGPPTYFKSRRIQKGQQERPWLDRKDPKEKWVSIIPVIGIFIGLGISGVQIWLGLQRISNQSYCSILDEDWAGGFNEEVWTKEVEVGGFGYALRLPETNFIADTI